MNFPCEEGGGARNALMVPFKSFLVGLQLLRSGDFARFIEDVDIFGFEREGERAAGVDAGRLPRSRRAEWCARLGD